ncbi:MAG: polysaccharide biosynthesis protein [Parcubacteria group bacterium Gr01-1014_38]|nr:MAG: polysaccharide biosynthesis protein [Parcubacteria group bacterium Gr01-1014_38]
MSVLPPRLLSGAAVSTFGRVLGTLVSVLTVGVVTRSLAAGGGVAAYGTYATIFAFLAVAAVVADGGLYLVFTKWAAREDAEGESRIFQAVLRLRFVSLGVALFLLATVVSVLPYPAVVRAGVLLGTVGVGSQLVTQLLLGVFQKRLRMLAPAVSEVLGRGATLLFSLLISWRGGGVLAFVGAFVVGALVTLVGNLLAVRRFLTAPSAHPGPRASAVIREAWPLGLMLICWLLVFRVDSVLLSLFRPPEELGWYALPYKVLESLLFFPAMIGGLLLPALSKEAIAEKRRFSEALSAATSLFLVLTIPTVALLFLSAPWVIAVLGGPGFSPSVPVLRILAVALGTLFFGNLYGNSAIALGAQRSLLRAAMILALFNILVNLVIIPRYSFFGAAWTTLGTELLSALTAFGIVWRRVRFTFFSAPNWHIASAGGVLLLVSFLPLPSSLRIMMSVSAYAAALWVLGVLTPRRLAALLRAQRLSGSSPVGEL